jgi:hypothetical protein
LAVNRSGWTRLTTALMSLRVSESMLSQLLGLYTR